MKLDAWMEKYEISANEVANGLDCTASTVFLWKRGKFKPSKHLMKKLQEFTDGKVTSKDFKKRKNDDK